MFFSQGLLIYTLKENQFIFSDAVCKYIPPVLLKLVYIISLLGYCNQINFDMLLQNVADKVAIKNVGWFSRILANIRIAKIKLLCLILHLLFYLNLCLELPRGHWTVKY